jgi:hypothetical protein
MVTLSRRSVLKGIAAAMMCPTIQLRASVPDERLLLPFCDPDATRDNFEAFGYGSLTYATDSRSSGALNILTVEMTREEMREAI